MLRRAALALLAFSCFAGIVAACVGDSVNGDGNTVCTGSGCADGSTDAMSAANDGDPGDSGIGAKETGPVGDGSCTHPCNGDPLWIRGFGSTAGDLVDDVKVDSAGNMYILGIAGGPFPIGAGGAGPSVATGRFVIKLDKDGKAVWSKALGGSVTQSHIAVANNALYVAGVYFKNTMLPGNITWGGVDTTLPTNVGAPNGYDIFVLEIDLDGNQLAATSIGAPGYDEMDAVGVDSDGAPVIFGVAAAQINFGGKTISAGPFVLKMTTALAPQWVCTIALGATASARAKAIGSLTGQGVYVAGRTLGSVTWCGTAFGGGTAQEAFVLHLQSSDGSLAAANSNPSFAYGNDNIGQPADVTGLAIGTNDAGAGGVYFSGSFTGSLSIGSPSQELYADDGGLNDTTPASYVGLFDKSSGLPLASRAILDNNTQSKYALAVDPFGGVVLAGLFRGSVDFGGVAPLTSAGDTDGILALYDPLLKKPAWSYRLGGPITDAVVGLGTDALGNVYAAGQWQGTADFPGGKTMMSNGGVSNLFVMKLAH